MAEPDNKSSSVCPRCGKTPRETKSGTITGWIFDASSCRCDALRFEKQASTTPIICLNCNLPVAFKRKASITQWIFPSGKCSCERPRTSFAPPQGGTASAIKTSGTNGSANSRRKDDAASSRRASPKNTALSESGSRAHAMRPYDTSADPKLEGGDPKLDGEDPKLVEVIGQLPERFTPLKYLGRGAVSVVCAAKDNYLGRVVAVKVFDQGGMDAAELIRFQSEAQIISRMDHHNIVQVFDFGINDSGKPFMVLEYVNGNSLRHSIKTIGQLSTEDAISIFTGVASALAYAHENGFSHRDLKPENLIIQADSQSGITAKIIDFGLAKYVNARDAFTTQTGISLIGTPPYMPPDQASGKAYDERSEIYSFGCVLFESLAGRPPFLADTPLEMIAKHCTEEPPHLLELNPDTDEELSLLVQQCLNKNPDDRPQSFQEIVTLLENMGTDSSRSIALNVAEPVKASNARKLILGISTLAALSFLLLLPKVFNQEKTETNKSKAGPQNGKTASPSAKNATALGDHIETFSLDELDPELKNLDLIQKDSNLTPKADEMMLRVVSNVSTLKKADFSNTDLTDKVLSKIGGLNEINELKLDDCKITDVGLKQLADRAPKLTKLSIADIAQLSAEGLKTLRRLPLTELNCSGNQLTKDEITELSNFKAKKFLLRDIGMNDQSAKFFKSQTAEYVDLRANNLDIEGLSALIKLPSIKTIILSPSKNLTSEKIDSLKTSLNSLCEIMVKGAHQMDAGESNSTKEASHLVSSYATFLFDPRNNAINLHGRMTIDDHNNLHGRMTIDDYKKLLNFPQATRLNANMFQKLDVEGFKIISKMPLQTVDLTTSDADDKILSVVCEMPKLKRLVLSNTTVTDAGLTRLAAVKDLNELILDGCQITDAGLAAISQCAKLQRLGLKHISQLSAKGIRSLGQLPLTNINFDDNELDDDAIKAASQLKAIHYSFQNTGLDDRKVSLFNCPQAQSLQLLDNNIGPDGLTAIMKLPALAKVTLSTHSALTKLKLEGIKRAANKQNCVVEIRERQ